MKTVIINIGLDVSKRFKNPSKKREISRKKAMKKLAKYNIGQIWAIEYIAKTKENEAAFIIKLVVSDNDTKFNNKIYQLSCELKQDCISVYDVAQPDNSRLIGKYNKLWGAFNIQYFRFFKKLEKANPIFN